MAQIEMGSLFAGIGGFDLAAERVGFRVAWHSEIDKYSSRVLKYRWPNIPNLGDINDIRDPQWVDILAGGFPCQSYSVAGNRGGLADDRGALWWQYHRLIDQIRPTWVVGENVPGLLSSAGGRDFETIIRSLTEIGYGVVWSVLDSQYFGVPQRRRRVFIVGHSGGRPRPEILALAEGMFGHPAPSREEEQDIAAALESRATPDRLRAERGHIVGTLRAGQGPANLDHQAVEAGQIIGFTPGASSLTAVEDAAPTMTGRHGDQGGVVYAPEVAGTLTRRDDKGPREDIAEPNMVTYVSKLAQTGSNGLGISGKDIDGEETAHTLDSSGPEAVITTFAQNQRAEVRDLKDVAGSLAANPGMKQQTYVAEVAGTVRSNMRNNSDPATEAKQHVYELNESDIRIRKLTPLECERLQGFPDGWTDIPKNSDTQRYKQLGNAVTVNTVQWIMERIAATYDDLYLDPKVDR